MASSLQGRESQTNGLPLQQIMGELGAVN